MATQSPWLLGIKAAAEYAHTREGNMRRLVKSGEVLSRKPLPDEDGHVPRGVLVYAPSIDALIISQPSGAAPIARAASQL